MDRPEVDKLHNVAAQLREAATVVAFVSGDDSLGYIAQAEAVETAAAMLDELYTWLAFDYKIGTNYGGDIGWGHTYDSDERKAILEKLKPFSQMDWEKFKAHTDKKPKTGESHDRDIDD